MADINYPPGEFAGKQLEVFDGLILAPENPTQYSDICKLSQTVGCIFKNFRIVGGSEDCLDSNNGSFHNIFSDGSFKPNGKFVMTLKGNTRYTYFSDITVDGHGTEVDIDIGNFSEQSMKLSKDIGFRNVNASDGKPLTMRVGWARTPIILNSNIKILFWQSLGLKLYVLFQWAKHKVS